MDDAALGTRLPLSCFEARRKKAAAALDGEILIVGTHAEALHHNDVHHRFRPGNDFWYLTGFAEPGAVLALDDSGHSTLFLQPRQPDAEIWTGRRLGLERAIELGVDQARDIGDLSDIGDVIGDRAPLVILPDPSHHETVGNVCTFEDGHRIVADLRAIKAPQEIQMMQKAADVGCAAFEAAKPAMQKGNHEYHVEAALLHHYRSHGSTGPGYPPIVGSADNAAILHYIDNQASIRDGFLLIDAGCEWDYYQSDITRTYAIGEVSEKQRDLHDLVLEAHQAALAEVQVGKPFRAPHDAAVHTLAEGLLERGLLSGSLEKVLESHAYRRYFMHGTSHFLGLAVHDVRPGAPDEPITLQEGMALTVEPGLYFNPDFAACPEDLVGTGIRIEDDVVVTEDGPLVLTKGLDRGMDR